MIQSILLEYLADGAIPIYETTPTDPNSHWVLEFGDPLDLYVGDAHWREIRPRSHRIVIPLGIDMDMAGCLEKVDQWVSQAQRLPGNGGTLIFPIRTSAAFPDGSTYVCAGMGYTPNVVETATALDGTDPALLISQLLQGHRTHPLLRRVLEQREAEAREHRRYWLMGEEARRIEGKKDRLAFKRAAKLLDRYLTHKQRRELKKFGYIQVQGQDRMTYRIQAKDHQNIFRIKDGTPVMQFCVVSSQRRLPVPDLMLVQKLMLETNIEDFLNLANKWEVTTAETGRLQRVRVVEGERMPRIDPVIEADIRAREARRNIARRELDVEDFLENLVEPIDVAV